MKGCARSLFLGHAVYLAIGGGIAWLLHARFALPIERTWLVSAGTGFLAWVGLTLLLVVRKLGRRIRNSVVGGVLFLGLSAGILYAFLNHADLV